MAEYIYTRDLVSGSYNIENPARVDEGGDQIHLAKEVSDALPGKTFKMICMGTEVKFDFDIALDSGEQTTISNIVTAHKNNT